MNEEFEERDTISKEVKKYTTSVPSTAGDGTSADPLFLPQATGRKLCTSLVLLVLNQRNSNVVGLTSVVGGSLRRRLGYSLEAVSKLLEHDFL